MRWRKCLFSFAIIGCTACIGPLQALGATSSEIQDQIDAYMADLDASRQKSEDLETEISGKQKEVGGLYSEVAALNIEKATYYEEMKTRMVYFYEEMQTHSFLTTILTSHSFAEMINRIQFQQSIYDYDMDRLEEYQSLMDELEVKQEALDAEIESLGDMVEEQVVLQATLDVMISDKNTELAEVKEEEAAAAAAAAAAEAAAKEAERRASEEAAAYALSYEASSSAETESSSESSQTETVSAPEETSSSSTETSSTEETSSETSSSAETATVEKAEAATSSGSYNMPSGSGILTWSGGVNYFNGHMETWYTMREWKGELGIPGMYIGSDGIVRDCDGYICVASDDDPKGTIIETSLGTGKVYDCGPGHGIIDIYTDWPLY